MSDTVYITKYALSQGIFECRVIEWHKAGGAVSVKWPGGLNGRNYFSRADWCASLAGAEQRAFALRDKQVESLQKRIARLACITKWKVIEPT